MDIVESFKAAGNAEFGAAKYAEAVVSYTSALTAAVNMAVNPELLLVRSVLYSNRAAALLKSNPPDYPRAIADCNEALKDNGENTKALFRRATAHEELSQKIRREGNSSSQAEQDSFLEQEKALVDLTRCIQLDPKNKAVVTAAQRVKISLQEYKKLSKDYRPYLNKWKNKEGTTVDQAHWIGLLMSMFVGNTHTAKDMIADGFVDLLLASALPTYSATSSSTDASTDDAIDAAAAKATEEEKLDEGLVQVRTMAAQALRSVVSSPVCSSPTTKLDLEAFVASLRTYVQVVSKPLIEKIAERLREDAEAAALEAAIEEEEEEGHDPGIGEGAGEEVLRPAPVPRSPADLSYFKKQQAAEEAAAKAVPAEFPTEAEKKAEKEREKKRLKLKRQKNKKKGVVEEGDSDSLPVAVVPVELTAEEKAAEEREEKQERYVNMLIGLMSRIAANPVYEPFRKSLLEDLILLLQVPCVVQHSLLGPILPGKGGAPPADEEDSKPPPVPSKQELQRIVAVLQGFAVMAGGDHKAMKLVRNLCLPHLLFSRLVEIPEAKAALIGALVIVTKARGQKLVKKKDIQEEQKDKYGNVITPTEKEMLDKAIAQDDMVFQEQISRFILGPMTSPQKSTELKAVRALCLVLQSNPVLGIHIVTYKPPSPVLLDAEGKERAATKEEQEEQAAVLPVILEKLVWMSVGELANFRTLGITALALSSSDPVVRATIAVSGNVEVFFDLIHSTDALVAMHAGLALSRMAAVGGLEADIRDRIFEDDNVSRAIIAVMDLAREQEIAREKRQKQQAELNARANAKATEAAKARGESSVFLNMESMHNTLEAEDYSIISMDCVRDAVEALSYLSLNIEAKKVLVTRGGGKWLKTVFSYANCKDKAIRYGVVSIIYNLCTSNADIKADYNKEIEELRKVARKGLPGNDVKQEEEMIQKAGDPEAVEIVKKQLVLQGVVAALYTSFKMYIAEGEELLDMGVKDLKYEAPAGSPPSLLGDKPASKVPFARKNKNGRGIDGKDEKKEGRKDNQSTGQEKMGGISEEVACNLGRALERLASVVETRGHMVQQGALKLLLELCSHPAEKAHMKAATAAARISITTNPNLFSPGVVMSLIVPLLGLIEETDQELVEFEGAMALTNLATVDEQAREKIIAEHGWQTMTSLLSSDNFRVQRAAVQCLTNLFMSEKGMERLHSSAGGQDIRLFCLFCGTDDVETQEAASGGLAMISGDEVLADKICRRGAIDQFVSVLATPESSMGLRHRVNVTIQNLARACLDDPCSLEVNCNPAQGTAEEGKKIIKDLLSLKAKYDPIIAEMKAVEDAEAAEMKKQAEIDRLAWREKEDARLAKIAAEENEKKTEEGVKSESASVTATPGTGDTLD